MARDRSVKAATAFRTIGEVARDTGIAQHVLRYWETRFPQLDPVQRAGGRRHYRPADVALIRRIDTLLNVDGYTMRGVQQLLASERSASAPPTGDPLGPVRAIRDSLVNAISADDAVRP